MIPTNQEKKKTEISVFITGSIQNKKKKKKKKPKSKKRIRGQGLEPLRKKIFVRS